MTLKSRTSRIAVLALALTTFAAALPSGADAGEMMMRRHGMGGMGGMSDLGPGLALGLGAALLLNELGHRDLHRQAEADGWTPSLQRKHDCHRAEQWLDLKNKAQASLNWSRVNDPGGIAYDQGRVADADRDYRAAKRACSRQWF